MKKYITLSIAFILIALTSQSQSVSPLNIEAAYVGEGLNNFSGGLNSGRSYQGIIDLGLGFNTKNLGLWDNGEFFIQVENSHGATPSGSLIGDLQVASNIENGNYTYLYEMWYKQQIGALNVQLGLIDLNADYFVAEPGGLFFNSSFGIQPSVSMNIPVPIFPMNAFGLSLRYEFSDAFAFQTGLWDGDPGNLDDNPYNTAWNWNSNQGLLSVSELHIKHGISNDSYNGIIKLGVAYHTAEFIDLNDATKSTNGNLQIHLIAEQTLISKPEGEKGKLDAFTQIGYLPDNTINQFSFYLGAGINYTGLLFNDASDVFGLAFGHASMSSHMVDASPNMLGAETAIELTYAFPLMENISIQPDIQYIINPGVNKAIDNALVGLLRVVIEH